MHYFQGQASFFEIDGLFTPISFYMLNYELWGALSVMCDLLTEFIYPRGGSQVVWIAPSGGRDRPDPVTEEWYPVSFCTLFLKEREKCILLHCFMFSS